MCCLLSASLSTMSIGTGVIGAVALQQVHNAPNAKASAESNNEGLQSVNSRCEKSHIYSFSPGTMPRPRKKPPRVGRQLPLGQLVSKSRFIQKRPDRQGHRSRGCPRPRIRVPHPARTLHAPHRFHTDRIACC